MAIVKTLLDIDDRLLRDARRVAGATTKKETVAFALRELIRAKKRAGLASRIGCYRHGMSLKKLLSLRARS